MMPPVETKNPFRDGGPVIPGYDPEQYFKENTERGQKAYVMSRSSLREFSTCPHRWLMGYSDDDTPSTEWGTLMDARVLTPDSFIDRFAVEPDYYTPAPKPKSKEIPTPKPWNRNAGVCEEWAAKQTGKTIVRAKHFKEASVAMTSLYGHKDLQDLLNESQKQVYVLVEYHDDETGIVVQVKCLIDFVPGVGPWGKSLGDYKTAANASPDRWGRAVFECGYHYQAALYLDAYTAATGEDRTDWLHIIQENFFPYEVGKRLLSVEFIEMGRRQYVADLKNYCRCLYLGEWPGYDNDQTINGFTLTEPEPWMILK